MARLTVEDCLKRVKNRFELVLKAAKRARLLERGAEPRVPWDNDKPTVVALREISEGFLNEPEGNKAEGKANKTIISDEIESVVEEEPLDVMVAETTETIEESEPEEEISPFSVAAPAELSRTPDEKSVEYLTVAVPPPAEPSSDSEVDSERDQEQE